MNPATRLTLAPIASGLLLIGIALSCGGDPSLTEAVPTEQIVGPKAALRQAVDQVLQLESAAFTLEHQTGTTTLFPGLEMTKAYGIVDIPDRFSLTVEAQSTVPRFFVEIDIVTIEDQAYMTDVLTGEWQQVSQDVVPVNFADLGQTLAHIIEALHSPVLVSAERLRGYDTYHINGRIVSEDLAGIVPGAGEGFDGELDLWLDQSRSLLIQVLISGRVVPTDSVDTVRLLTLDDINVPVEISPPR